MAYRIHKRPCQHCGRIGVYCTELCKGCYEYKRKHGTTVRASVSVEDRFWAKVRKAEGAACWEWTGCRTKQGYGLFGKYGPYSPSAHRTSWMILRGAIPDGLQLDHLCRNTSCVNPEHLEAVTGRENMRRAKEARTVCKNGHALSGMNVRVDKNGRRWCRTCQKVNLTKFHERNPEYKTTGQRTVMLKEKKWTNAS